MIDRGEMIRKLVLNAARFTGIAPLSKSFLGGIGAILMLHSVTATPRRPNGFNRHLNVHPDFLDRLLDRMKRDGYEFVSLDDALQRIASGGGSNRFATITADDGYRDNLTEALPVFAKHGTPFTVYVAPAQINREVDLWWEVVEDVVEAREQLRIPTKQGLVTIDCSTCSAKAGANAWLHNYLTTEVSEQDQRAVLRDIAAAVGVDPSAPSRDGLMNWDEVRKLAAHPLATIGAHTVHHYSLRRLSEAKARREIADCAGILEFETGERPRHLAYPYGFAAAVGDREVAIARQAGYASAVTTRHGLVRAEHAKHLQALPRISVNGRYQRIGHVQTMLSGVTTPIANSGKLVVTV